MRNRFYAVRHGESAANEAAIVVSAPEHGVPGYGLTTLGRHQAQQVRTLILTITSTRTLSLAGALTFTITLAPSFTIIMSLFIYLLYP